MSTIRYTLSKLVKDKIVNKKADIINIKARGKYEKPQALIYFFKSTSCHLYAKRG